MTDSQPWQRVKIVYSTHLWGQVLCCWKQSKCLPAINHAKIRGSWAQAGGDTDPYNLSLYYGLTGAHLGQINGSQVPNSNLQPLTSTTFELGFETRLFNNRLGIDFAIYNRKTTNDIVAASIPGTSGFSTALFNAGQIKNNGVELLMNYRVVKSSAFTCGRA